MGDQNQDSGLEFTEVVPYVVVWSLPYPRPRPVSTYSVTVIGTPGIQTTTVTQTFYENPRITTTLTITPSIAPGGGTANPLITFGDTTTSRVIDTESPITGTSEPFPDGTNVFQAESRLSSDNLVPTTSPVGPSVVETTAADFDENDGQSATKTARTSATTGSTVPNADSGAELSSSSAVSLQTESPTTQRKGISPGAAAGISVGSALAGAILATLIAFFLLHRRRSRGRGINSGRNSPMQMNDYPFVTGKSAGTSAVPLSLTYLDEQLSPPTDGSDITDEMAALGSHVTAHVDRFFSGEKHVSPISQPEYGDLAFKLAELLHSDPPIDTGHLAMLLFKPASRPAAVRFILAWSILTNIESGSPPLTTLLPPELSECMQALSDKTGPDPTRAHQVNRWRHVTASLMVEAYPTTHITAGDPRQHNLAELYSALDDVLRPFSSQGDSEAREGDLRQLLGQGALLGWSMFSQPAHWSFEWGGRCDVVGQGEVVVWPALVRRETDIEVDGTMEFGPMIRVRVGP